MLGTESLPPDLPRMEPGERRAEPLQMGSRQVQASDWLIKLGHSSVGGALREAKVAPLSSADMPRTHATKRLFSLHRNIIGPYLGFCLL